MKKDVVKMSFLGLCFMLLFLPLLNHLFHFNKESTIDENRTTNDSLSFSFAHIDAFPEDCENYLLDHFNFRTELLKVNNSLYIDLLKISPDHERIIIGTNGRYYYGGEVVQDFNGENLFSKQQLQSISEDWEKRVRFINNHQAKVAFLVTPTTLDIYPEQLPYFIKNTSGTNRREQLMKHFQSIQNLTIIDPTEELFAQNKLPNLYFKYDNHWTQNGAKIAAQKLLKALEANDPALKIDYIQGQTFKKIKIEEGYFSKLLIQEDSYEWTRDYLTNAIPADKFGFQSPNGFPYPDSFERHFKNPKAPNKKKVMIICDSFSDGLLPFINEGFSETLWIFDAWQYKLNENIIEQFQPDIVIFEVNSQNLKNLLQ